MIRLVLILCAGLYGVLALAGADHGQKRLGLTGAYAVATSLPDPVPPPAPKAPAEVATKAVYTPAQPVMTAPAVAVQPAAAAASVAPEPEMPEPDIRHVIASSVNVRGGPSTNDRVVGRLVSGDEVLVVGEAVDGWVEVRIEGDGVDGFVASRFLSGSGQ